MTSEQEAELAQRRLRNAIACDGGEVRLTDAEREALGYFAVQASAYGATDFAAWARHAATLRSLLARLG